MKKRYIKTRHMEKGEDDIKFKPSAPSACLRMTPSRVGFREFFQGWDAIQNDGWYS